MAIIGYFVLERANNRMNQIQIDMDNILQNESVQDESISNMKIEIGHQNEKLRVIKDLLNKTNFI